MNLMLFEESFETIRLPAADDRTQHMHKVLRVKAGSLVFIGFVNGLRARAEVLSIDSDGSCELKVVATEAAPEPLPIALMIGLPRPHTVRRILFDAASLGVEAMHFFPADYSEPSYAKSRLWHCNEWRERILRGTEQAFGTHLPKVKLHPDAASAFSEIQKPALQIALDNYEASCPLSSIPPSCNHTFIAIGPERGWSSAERSFFRKNQWSIVHLGPHVLRTETACVAAISAMAAKLDLWKNQTETVCL